MERLTDRREPEKVGIFLVMHEHRTTDSVLKEEQVGPAYVTRPPARVCRAPEFAVCPK